MSNSPQPKSVHKKNSTSGIIPDQIPVNKFYFLPRKKSVFIACFTCNCNRNRNSNSYGNLENSSAPTKAKVQVLSQNKIYNYNNCKQNR